MTGLYGTTVAERARVRAEIRRRVSPTRPRYLAWADESALWAVTLADYAVDGVPATAESRYGYGVTRRLARLANQALACQVAERRALVSS